MVAAVSWKPKTIPFNHSLKRCCSLREIKEGLLYEILISKDPLQDQKVVSLVKDEMMLLFCNFFSCPRYTL